jgi:hypothetical protein
MSCAPPSLHGRNPHSGTDDLRGAGNACLLPTTPRAPRTTAVAELTRGRRIHTASHKKGGAACQSRCHVTRDGGHALVIHDATLRSASYPALSVTVCLGKGCHETGSEQRDMHGLSNGPRRLLVLARVHTHASAEFEASLPSTLRTWKHRSYTSTFHECARGRIPRVLRVPSLALHTCSATPLRTPHLPQLPLQLQKSGRSSDVSKRGCHSRMERTYVMARPATASHSAPRHSSHETRLYDRGDGVLGAREMSLQL